MLLGGPRAATTTYIKAQLREVAAALAAMTGEPHPLAAGAEDVTNLLGGASHGNQMP